MYVQKGTRMEMDMIMHRPMTSDMSREELLKRIMAYRFAAYDLQLYLDTHPDDMKAFNLFKRMTEAAEDFTEKFEAKYGPLTDAANARMDRWKWIDDPFPWDRMSS
jgi:spore coat protein JB